MFFYKPVSSIRYKLGCGDEASAQSHHSQSYLSKETHGYWLSILAIQDSGQTVQMHWVT